jgi:hypothetical protein
MTARIVVLSLAMFASVAVAEPFNWIVVIDDVAYVRTNASKWLANIRRGSAVRVRVRGLESGVLALEVADAALKAQVEKAFKKKYGSMQRIVSLFRMSEPVVLRLAPKAN